MASVGFAPDSRVGFSKLSLLCPPPIEIPAYARSAGFGDASTRYIQTFNKRVFQQKFRPKYAYILEKRL